MNGIIAALFILMMFVFSVGGREFERADSTGYSYPSLIYIDTVEEEFYQYLSENPEWFIEWLYSHYYILDMKNWKKEGEVYKKNEVVIDDSVSTCSKLSGECSLR